MSCNSESRRAINYSLQEPINNKYDLWLSENLRYNSEGTLIYDSPGQPACDLILKIYKDGDWKPIAGLSTDHIVANKINIVDGVNYTYISPNDNTLHTNDGFQQNHLPLFRNPQDSPNELFDAGTPGEAIYGFVTESEWLNIFEGEAFSGAFTLWFPTIINNGDININGLIELANTEQIGGIKADTHDMVSHAFKPVECKLYPNYGNWSSIHERLCINARDVIDSIIESFSDPDENWLFGNHGITVGLQLNGNRIEWAVDGLGNATNGQYARCKVTEGVDRHSIEWVDLPEIQTYELLGPDSSALEKYVVKGGSNDKRYLNGNGEWTIPTGTEYEGGTFIRINLNHIDIRPNSDIDTRKTYLCSYNGSVSWDVIDAGTLYQEGVGIKFGNGNSINIDTTEASTQGQVLSYDGNGGVEWAEVQPIEYEEGNGIDIDSNKILCNIETIDEGTPGRSLNVSWTTQRDSILITDNSTYNKSIGLYEVYYNDTQADYTFSLVNNGAQFENNNPIYLRLNIKNLSLADGTKYIGDIIGNGEYLVTIQFGVIKFELINTYTSQL